MAVTQQALMLSDSDLEKCRNDKYFLEEALSLVDAPSERYKDFDWYLSFIGKLIKVNDLSLYLTLEGVIDGSADFEYYLDDFEEQPRYISNIEIKNIIKSTAVLGVGNLIDSLPNNVHEINLILGSDFDENPKGELTSYWKQLMEYCSYASCNGYSIVFWWD